MYTWMLHKEVKGEKSTTMGSLFNKAGDRLSSCCVIHWCQTCKKVCFSPLYNLGVADTNVARN